MAGFVKVCSGRDACGPGTATGIPAGATSARILATDTDTGALNRVAGRLAGGRVLDDLRADWPRTQLVIGS